MFFITSIIVSLLGTILATYTDLKYRIVPNKLNFGLAGIGLFIYAIQSLITQTPLPFLYSIWGLLFGFIFGWLLWKIGVFAGGDVKLFMALGALNPFTPALLKTEIFITHQFNVFPLTLFIYSTLAFLPYGIFIVFYKLSKNKPFQKKLWSEMKTKLKQTIHLAIFSAGIYTIFNFYNINGLAIIPIIILWSFLKNHKIIFTIIIFLGAVILNPVILLQNTLYSTLLFVGIFTLIKLLFSMKPLLSKEIKVLELEEGMIPSKSLLRKGNKIIEADEISIKKILEYIKLNKLSDLFSPKNEIVSSRKARGLTIEELKEIKKLAKTKKIPSTIFVKDTMPFVPTVLLGYIACIIFGDAWLIIIGGII
jgi:archaeal preflagellin peptidase FlaK